MPYSEIQDEKHAHEVLMAYGITTEKVMISEDEVVANQRLLEAILYLGIQEINVVKLPIDPEDPDMMRNMPGGW